MLSLAQISKTLFTSYIINVSLCIFSSKSNSNKYVKIAFAVFKMKVTLKWFAQLYQINNILTDLDKLIIP